MRIQRGAKKILPPPWKVFCPPPGVFLPQSLKKFY